jgi:hypothetical protein
MVIGGRFGGRFSMPSRCVLEYQFGRMTTKEIAKIY